MQNKQVQLWTSNFNPGVCSLEVKAPGQKPPEARLITTNFVVAKTYNTVNVLHAGRS